MTHGAPAVSSLEIAKRYLAVGWVPVPIPRGAKGPIEPNWTKRTLAGGLAGFDERPQNIGVLLGAPSGGLIDADLDCPEAVALAPHFLEPTAVFGRASNLRSHWIYRGEYKSSRFTFGDTTICELRSTGLQTVFPGSVHPSGEPVTWEVLTVPATCADLDTRLLHLAIAAVLLKHWPGSHARHDARLALAGGLASVGWSEDDTQRLMGAIAECAADRDGDSATAVTTTYAAISEGRPVKSWGSLVPHVGAAPVAWVQARLEGGRPFIRGDHPELGARLLEALGLTAGDDDRLWRYDGGLGLWSAVDEDEQIRTVGGFAGSRMRSDKKPPLSLSIGDAVGAMRYARADVAQKNFFAKAPAGIAFTNGFMRVVDARLDWHEHSPDNRARGGYEFAYSDAEPRAWQAYLLDVFRSDADAFDRIQAIQEYFGACVFGLGAHFGMALVLVSDDGAAGKTTVLETLAGAMPANTTASIPPQLWDSEYRRAALAGVRFNYVNELPSQDLTTTESFKAIIDGNPIDARHIRRAQFTLRPIAGHAFACNALPPTPDVSSAFFRRILLLRFANTIDPAKLRVKFFETVLKERPAIVAWGIAGLKRLLERGRYLVPPSTVEQLRLWRARADSVSTWVHEACEATDAWGNANALYQHYTSWCTQGGFKPGNRNTWGQRLVSLGVTKRSASGANQYALAIRPLTRDNVLIGPWQK